MGLCFCLCCVHRGNGVVCGARTPSSWQGWWASPGRWGFAAWPEAAHYSTSYSSWCCCTLWDAFGYPQRAIARVLSRPIMCPVSGRVLVGLLALSWGAGAAATIGSLALDAATDTQGTTSLYYRPAFDCGSGSGAVFRRLARGRSPLKAATAIGCSMAAVTGNAALSYCSLTYSVCLSGWCCCALTGLHPSLYGAVCGHLEAGTGGGRHLAGGLLFWGWGL
jgi:hypothetical protein